MLRDRLVELFRLLDAELLTAIRVQDSVQFDHEIILETLWVFNVRNLCLDITGELKFFLGLVVSHR